MKKVFLLACMLFSTLLTFAQIKKVAILEVVDRENTLSYGVKLMLRSYLAEAVTTTKGYEAYDRTDLNKILDEQKFQRTGYVSDEEIKKIGEMTGVQYILVAEASKINTQSLFVTAKILNVETARVETTASAMTNTDVPSLQQGTKDMAERLLGVVNESTPQQKEDIVHYNMTVTETEYIKRIRANEYSIGGKMVDRKTYYKFLYNNRQECPLAYNQFLSGKKLTIAGWCVLGAGGALLASGLGVCFAQISTGLGLLGTGIGIGIMGGVAVPLVSVGYWKKHNAYQKYNEYCAPKNSNSILTLNLQSSQNGLGLALQF